MKTAISARFQLFLLTQGEEAFQQSKIERLRVNELFQKTIIVSAGSGRSKKEHFQDILEEYQLVPKRVVVVGNRLDNEIQIGKELGCATIWIRHGEGAEMVPYDKASQPDQVISDLGAIEFALWSLATMKGDRRGYANG